MSVCPSHVCYKWVARGGGGNPLSPNSSETAWNFKTPFYRMEAGRLRMVYVNFHKPICPRDFSITIYYFYWVWPTKSIRSQIMRLSINLKKGLQARSASHMSTTLMAGPKGQPYVYNTYGWPEGPAIISRDSSLGRRPSLFP